jgi:16S rRNA (cytosine967-C5)-methyltransferase
MDSREGEVLSPLPRDPTRWLSLAAKVVEQSSRERPADAVLRQQLRNAGGLSNEEAAQVSRTVFSFFRWRGWLDDSLKLESQIRSALELTAEFAMNPQSFPDADLLARTLPAWVNDCVPISAAWLRVIQAEPTLWLRVRPGRAKSIAQVLGHTHTSALPDALAYAGKENLFRQPEFHAGEFEIQDVASQAVGLICGAKPGETWWDACAGEGGKLLHLSAQMQGKGLIWASDRAEWRLKQLKLRTARAQCFNYRAALWDGGAKLPTKTRFDGVLLDAPCSGLGTWQRNPHARWTTSPDDVRELAEVQKKLLHHLAPSVKPDGKLIYSVCTLTRAETEEVAAAFQAAHPEFTPLPLPDPFHTNEPPRAQHLLWPQGTGGGGMFIAAWKRAK